MGSARSGSASFGAAFILLSCRARNRETVVKRRTEVDIREGGGIVIRAFAPAIADGELLNPVRRVGAFQNGLCLSLHVLLGIEGDGREWEDGIAEDIGDSVIIEE